MVLCSALLAKLHCPDVWDGLGCLVFLMEASWAKRDDLSESVGQVSVSAAGTCDVLRLHATILGKCPVRIGGMTKTIDCPKAANEQVATEMYQDHATKEAYEKALTNKNFMQTLTIQVLGPMVQFCHAPTEAQ